MRIISQGSHADLPYERTTICLDCNNIIARCDGKEYLMGVYSSKEKAVKATKMCRKEYLDFETYGSNMFPFESPKVFQFPVDDEI